MRTTSHSIALVVGVIAVAALAIASGRRHAARAETSSRAALEAAPPVLAASAEATDLPAPVARYLQLALGATPAPDTVEMRQHGTLRTDETTERWMPFSAVHRIRPQACGFVWNARIDAAPLLHLRVLDSLVRGRGEGRVILQSLLTIARDGGTPPMDAGSLHRFLAEAVWYPWALRPGPALRWTPVDERRARATLSCHGTTVSLDFIFGDDGLVRAIHTPARWGRFDGHFEQLPWEGHFDRYTRRGGVQLPDAGEVGWVRDGELRLVWRGTIDDYRLIGDSR